MPELCPGSPHSGGTTLNTKYLYVGQRLLEPESSVKLSSSSRKKFKMASCQEKFLPILFQYELHAVLAVNFDQLVCGSGPSMFSDFCSEWNRPEIMLCLLWPLHPKQSRHWLRTEWEGNLFHFSPMTLLNGRIKVAARTPLEAVQVCTTGASFRSIPCRSKPRREVSSRTSRTRQTGL